VGVEDGVAVCVTVAVAVGVGVAGRHVVSATSSANMALLRPLPSL
jgi:hypothetical protein